MNPWPLAPGVTVVNDVLVNRTVLDRLPAGVAVWQAQEGAVYTNRALHELLGRPEHSGGFTVDELWDRVVPVTPRQATGPALLRGLGGNVVPVHVVWEPLVNLLGESIGQVAVLTRLGWEAPPAILDLVVQDGHVVESFAGSAVSLPPQPLSGLGEADALVLLESLVAEGRLRPFRLARQPLRPGLEVIRLIPAEPASEPTVGVQDLIAATAHEMRNPLATIRGFLQILPRASAEDRERYVSILLREVDRLSEVLTDVLENQGRYAAGVGPVDVPGVVDDVLHHMEPLASLRQVQVGWKEGGRPDEAIQVVASPGRLFQVVQNVVQNAVDASPPGSGRVEVTVQRAGPRVLILVDDNGPGFPSRGRVNRERGDHLKSGGHGLGLAIARWLLAMHGGSLEHTRSPLGGARAVIDLPAQRSREASTEAPA